MNKQSACNRKMILARRQLLAFHLEEQLVAAQEQPTTC
jgi:hypothetical protein